METAILKITDRKDTSSRANKRLRKTGYVPGNIFGKDIESVSVAVKKDELRKGLIKYGRSALFKLEADGGKTYNVMVKDIQNEPISREFIHVDFQQITLSEEVKANVPIKIEGKEALESKRLLLMRQIDIIPVKGLPQDIPNSIDIDVSGLKGGENIYVSDVKFPGGIVPEINPEQLIISVSEAKAQMVIEEEEAEVL